LKIGKKFLVNWYEKFYIQIYSCVFQVSDLRVSRETTKRVQLSFTKEQWKILGNFRGIMGNSDADIVRNIVLAWLSEKSIISSKVKLNLEREK